jgi:adenosylmethionine-8-amino-7-oxononanoate aminotransferase
LTGPNALAAPFVFDIRGRGGFWAVEFDFETSKHMFQGSAFSMLLQARAMENGLIIMGMTGGANLEGTRGDHIMLSPAYNVTKEEVQTIAKIFIRSVNEVLEEYVK